MIRQLGSLVLFTALCAWGCATEHPGFERRFPSEPVGTDAPRHIPDDDSDADPNPNVDADPDPNADADTSPEPDMDSDPDPVNPCDEDNGGCDPLVTCSPEEDGSVTCGPCPDGYTGDGLTGCQADTTCDGDAIIHSHEELLAWTECEEIAGDLEITESDLAEVPLSRLRSVGGSVYISHNPDLEDIDGLSNLKEVGEHIKITDNESLTDVDGLVGIRIIPGELYLIDNGSLSNIEGLRYLDEVKGRLMRISGSLALHNLHGLISLEHVGGTLSIWGNPMINDLTGLETLETVGGFYEDNNLELNYNDSLQNIDALAGLTAIRGSLQVAGNFALQHLAGLENITAIEADMLVINNRILATCDVENLKESILAAGGIGGSITIAGNDGQDAPCP